MSNARNLARLLPNASGQLPDANLAAIAAGKVSGQLAKTNMASGSIIQVVSSVLASPLSLNTTGATTVLSASITPTLSTSKIMVLITCDWNSGNPNAAFFVTRNNGVLNPTVQLSGSWMSASMGVTGGYKDLDEQPIDSWNTINEILNVIDNPATTSTLTYRWGINQLGNGSSTEFGRSSASAGYGGNGGRIILMEIAA